MKPEVTEYWRRTLPLFVGRAVIVRLVDGRERRGALSSDGRDFRVWTDEGPATIPLSMLRSVEQA